jgi:hypothetical protein
LDSILDAQGTGSGRKKDSIHVSEVRSSAPLTDGRRLLSQMDDEYTVVQAQPQIEDSLAAGLATTAQSGVDPELTGG